MPEMSHRERALKVPHWDIDHLLYKADRDAEYGHDLRECQIHRLQGEGVDSSRLIRVVDLEQAFAAVAAEARAGGVREAAGKCENRAMGWELTGKTSVVKTPIDKEVIAAARGECLSCEKDILALLDPEQGRGEGK